MQQLKGIHIQISVCPKGGLAIAYIHDLVNYRLISSLQLAKLLGSRQAHPVTAVSAKYCATL